MNISKCFFVFLLSCLEQSFNVAWIRLNKFWICSYSWDVESVTRVLNEKRSFRSHSRLDYTFIFISSRVSINFEYKENVQFYYTWSYYSVYESICNFLNLISFKSMFSFQSHISSFFKWGIVKIVTKGYSFNKKQFQIIGWIICFELFKNIS